MSLIRQIKIEDPEGVLVDPASEQSMTELKNILQGIATTRGIANDIRVTILSGTVTTVTTLTGITNIGGNAAVPLIPAIQNAAAQNNINNIAIS